MTSTPQPSDTPQPDGPGPAAPTEAEPVPDPTREGADASADAPAAGSPAADAPLPSPARHRRLRRTLQFSLAFALGLAVVAAVSVVALALWDAGYEARVLPGVSVGTVGLGGLDRAGAAAAIAAGLPYGEGRLVLRTPSGDVAVPYSAFGRRPDVDALVDAAMGAGREPALADRLVAELGQAVRGVSLAPHVLVDRDALAGAVAAALRPLRVSPVDATIASVAGSVATSPARQGQAPDVESAVAAALDAVSPADAPAEVVVQVAMTPIAPAVTDAAVQEAARDAGLIAGGPVTLALGTRTWTVRASFVRSWLGFSVGADGSVRPTLDTDLIAASLTAVAKAALSPATSAVYLRAKGGRVVGVAPSRDGRQLDIAATSQLIADTLLARASPSPPAAAPVAVVLAPTPPKLTTEQASQNLPVLTLLGTWTTYFPISDHNYYGANIWIPAQIINGTLLAPGQTFAWWRAVGTVSPARGFGPGGVIAGNHTDPTGALGGGMCSSSTTLFNAALRAGLRMGARGNHRYYISRYPLGLDATVWKMGGAVQDMSFTNDTGHPVLIVGLKSRSGGAGYVTYQLWGTPDGRTVSLSAPSVANVVRATTGTVLVDTLPRGARRQTEYPSNQMDVSVTRVVRDSGGRVIHSEVYRSHYVLWNGVIQVGR